jgi:hypothetical protein
MSDFTKRICEVFEERYGPGAIERFEEGLRKFPHDPDHREAWIYAIGKENYLRLSNSKEVSNET